MCAHTRTRTSTSTVHRVGGLRVPPFSINPTTPHSVFSEYEYYTGPPLSLKALSAIGTLISSFAYRTTASVESKGMP